ncbi:presqualene diphosphate synthase HpnD [Derxia gummosa]|uniref:Presqualene diphosphate synthase HpnD n=1 Tax=Derxia gummosa DSM 723 TaxID=1121388 RepID=A0A8B6X4B5_9BURK|nr:presqualene diphosphate synthase HpnD [Derxia gummosa]
MTPDEYCQDKAARSGSSFYYSFLFLPPPKRRAITAFYAFCREVDDAVDDAIEPAIARTKLDWWRTEVQRFAAGTPEHPVTRAMLPFRDEGAITPERLGLVIDGMQMDLEQTRYLDYKGLKHYCHLVAGVVGLVSAGIFGQTRPETSTYAEKFGLAFQLTNIIRDVGDDARRGRIYLPIEDLQRFNVKAAQILKRESSPEFIALMKFQADRARAVYAEALAALPAEDRRAQRAGLIMGAIYRTLLDEIEADNFPVLSHRVSLTPLRKLWIAWRTWVFGWKA